MTERDLVSLAWYCVRDAGKLTDQEMIDRLKALYGSGDTDAQQVLAQGLAMAVWSWMEIGGKDHANQS